MDRVFYRLCRADRSDGWHGESKEEMKNEINCKGKKNFR